MNWKNNFKVGLKEGSSGRGGDLWYCIGYLLGAPAGALARLFARCKLRPAVAPPVQAALNLSKEKHDPYVEDNIAYRVKLSNGDRIVEPTKALGIAAALWTDTDKAWHDQKQRSLTASFQRVADSQDSVIIGTFRRHEVSEKRMHPLLKKAAAARKE